jgi:hypothetical protein
MTTRIWLGIGAAIALGAGCGGGHKTEDTAPNDDSKGAPAGDPNAAFGPLEIGAGFESWTVVTKFAHVSPTHGNRFVDIFVNDVGLAAYTSDADFPVGTVIVKKSYERDGDKPSATLGPVFVMEKREAGFSPDHEDWYYAIRWENPTPKFQKQFGGPFYWRSPSAKVSYCWKCHDNYDREVGLPPKQARTWEPAAEESEESDESEESEEADDE